MNDARDVSRSIRRGTAVSSDLAVTLVAAACADSTTTGSPANMVDSGGDDSSASHDTGASVADSSSSEASTPDAAHADGATPDGSEASAGDSSVPLVAGNNTLLFSNGSAAAPDLSAIDVYP